MTDNVNHPAHYETGKFECIEVMLETVLQMNVDKLRNRYPNGFEKERSLHRQEGDV